MPRKKAESSKTVNSNTTPVPKDLISTDNDLTPDSNGFITIRGKKYHPCQLPPHWKQYYNPDVIRNVAIDGSVSITKFDAPSLKGQDD
ncbi:hypothetical protein [Chroococcidiopsis sp. CCNUC1]|uniref:hypothetical protein n=1 Tax=Chroococcidiopsis sp. CCNUC1 TaxID=2653189 RepID=UPI00202133EE|nr:hypothetical protein [Chroococcidiopsis sp. CCNUC1]URD50739.1 hypothetical protein M5J74_01840 [Chroococcidiopsis sp. CCNUC1]